MPNPATTDTTTAWNAYWSGVGNEENLTAYALVQLSNDVRNSLLPFLTFTPEEAEVMEDGENVITGGYWKLDWDTWATKLDEQAFSSTGHRLARLVAALTTGAPYAIADLSRMGSWEGEIWAILTTWGTGGNNRQYPGRFKVVPR